MPRRKRPFRSLHRCLHEDRHSEIPPRLAWRLYPDDVQDFFDQVARGGEGPHYYLALAAALMIPDICGAMEAEDGRSTGARYRAWFDKHVAPKHRTSNTGEPLLSGADCYILRCSLLHQGTTRHQKSRYSRILFTEPGPVTLHMNILDDALNIAVREFCQEMAEAASSWLATAKDNASFKHNYGKFLQRYPDGLPPYISGVPVIS